MKTIVLVRSYYTSSLVVTLMTYMLIPVDIIKYNKKL